MSSLPHFWEGISYRRTCFGILYIEAFPFTLTLSIMGRRDRGDREDRMKSSKFPTSMLKGMCSEKKSSHSMNVNASNHAHHAICTSVTVRLPTIKLIQCLAGKVPLDFVVIAHALNEHLIVQMLGKIDRFKALHNYSSASHTIRKNNRGRNLRSPYICLSKFRGWSYPGTRWPLYDRRKGFHLIANPSSLHDCSVSGFLQRIMDR